MTRVLSHFLIRVIWSDRGIHPSLAWCLDLYRNLPESPCRGVRRPLRSYHWLLRNPLQPQSRGYRPRQISADKPTAEGIRWATYRSLGGTRCRRYSHVPAGCAGQGITCADEKDDQKAKWQEGTQWKMRVFGGLVVANIPTPRPTLKSPKGVLIASWKSQSAVIAKMWA